MLPNLVVPRPAACTTCHGHNPVHPRIQVIRRGTDIVTEAHWVCTQCSSRFMSGTVSIVSETKKN